MNFAAEVYKWSGIHLDFNQINNLVREAEVRQNNATNRGRAFVPIQATRVTRGGAPPIRAPAVIPFNKNQPRAAFFLPAELFYFLPFGCGHGGNPDAPR